MLNEHDFLKIKNTKLPVIDISHNLYITKLTLYASGLFTTAYAIFGKLILCILMACLTGVAWWLFMQFKMDLMDYNRQYEVICAFNKYNLKRSDAYLNMIKKIHNAVGFDSIKTRAYVDELNTLFDKLEYVTYVEQNMDHLNDEFIMYKNQVISKLENLQNELNLLKHSNKNRLH